jgi:hypothetical protein
VCSSCDGSYRVFDTFTLSANSIIDEVTVSLYGYPFPVNVNVSIWSISGGLPSAQLFSETFAPSAFSSVLYPNPGGLYPDPAIITVNPTDLSLLAGTYDISFYNPDGLALKSYSGGSGLLYQQGNGFVVGASAGFILSGDVVASAVPGPIVGAGLPGMIFVGLAVLGWWSRKLKGWSSRVIEIG